MPIKVNCKNIERIIKTDTSCQITEIKKVYSNNTVVWSKKSDTDTSELFAKMANNVAYLINQERKALGRKQLYMVPHLNECAVIRAKEQVEQIGHNRPNGEHFTNVIDWDKVSWLSVWENIALGTQTAKETVNAWKNSSNHWSFATDPDWTHTGVGVYYDENSQYKWNWVQIFTYDIEPYAVYEDQYLPTNYEGEL